MNRLLEDDALNDGQKDFIRLHDGGDRKVKFLDIATNIIFIFSGIGFAYIAFCRDAFSLPVRNIIGFSVVFCFLLEALFIFLMLFMGTVTYAMSLSMDDGTKTSKEIFDFFKDIITVCNTSTSHKLLSRLNNISLLLILLGLIASGHWVFAVLQIFLWATWELSALFVRNRVKVAFRKFKGAKVEN